MTAEEKNLGEQIANLRREVTDLRELIGKVITGMRMATSMLPHITERRA